MKQWVIADIHGCLHTFQTLLEDKIQFSKEDTVYLLGDMIDRGPHSKETLDYIIQLQQEGYIILPIKGNHEESFLRSYYSNFDDKNIIQQLINKKHYINWIKCGGKLTLNSFQVKTIKDIPLIYINWLESLPYYRIVDNFIIVHAGLDFATKNPFSNIYSMLTCKKMKVVPELINQRTVIHGHIILPLKRIEYILKNRTKYNYISLDNGCIYANEQGFGNLIALNLDAMTLEIQKNID